MLKYIFLKRWQVKGLTPEALYTELQNLKFDPHKDDVEDFCNDVKNLAKRLGYPEEAQVMAIKTTLSPCLVTHCFGFKTNRIKECPSGTGRQPCNKENAKSRTHFH